MKKFEVYSENNNSLGYVETTSIGPVRLPQSTSQERIGKKIIRPNAINNASKHFPKDFFNCKDRVKKKREGAGTSEHCNRQKLGRSTISRMNRPFGIPDMIMNDPSNVSMSLGRRPPLQFANAQGAKDTIGACNGSVVDLTSLHQVSQQSSCDQPGAQQTRSGNRMALGDIVSNMNESIDSFKQGSQSKTKRKTGLPPQNTAANKKTEQVLTPQPDKIGSSSMVETFSNMKTLFQQDDYEEVEEREPRR